MHAAAKPAIAVMRSLCVNVFCMRDFQSRTFAAAGRFPHQKKPCRRAVALARKRAGQDHECETSTGEACVLHRSRSVGASERRSVGASERLFFIRRGKVGGKSETIFRRRDGADACPVGKTPAAVVMNAQGCAANARDFRGIAFTARTGHHRASAELRPRRFGTAVAPGNSSIFERSWLWVGENGRVLPGLRRDSIARLPTGPVTAVTRPNGSILNDPRL